MKYANHEKPPVCLHVLGQSLVNEVHAEARTLMSDHVKLSKLLGEQVRERQQLQAERDALSRALRMIREEMGNRISAAAFAEFSDEAKEMIDEALAFPQPERGKE